MSCRYSRLGSVWNHMFSAQTPARAAAVFGRKQIARLDPPAIRGPQVRVFVVAAEKHRARFATLTDIEDGQIRLPGRTLRRRLDHVIGEIVPHVFRPSRLLARQRRQRVVSLRVREGDAILRAQSGVRVSVIALSEAGIERMPVARDELL